MDTGDKAPAFTAPDQDGVLRSLKDYRGQTLILYFYPKDMTGGCTAQACSFRDHLARLTACGAQVLGLSPDSPARHRKFIQKEGLNFPLLSDEDHKVAEAYGVWKQKSMYGRTYMGIERTTFIIGPNGRIVKVFRKVKVSGHVQEVLDALGG